MEWINIKKQKPPISFNDENEEVDIKLLFRIKDEDEIYLIVGNYMETKGYTEKLISTSYNTKTIKIITHDDEEYIIPECMVGKHCDEAEIPMDDVTHWTYLPEKPKDE